MDIINFIILIVILGPVIYSCFIIDKLFKGFKTFVEKWEADNPQRIIKKFEKNTLMDDIVEYTINQGLECIIMPDANDKTNLLVKDISNDTIIPICEIPQVNVPERNTPTYADMISEMREKVKTFIKNNPQARKADVKN
jgi:hypothetical protein